MDTTPFFYPRLQRRTLIVRFPAFEFLLRGHSDSC